MPHILNRLLGRRVYPDTGDNYVKKQWLAKFRRFWTAEEVPRWFGLSLIVVYLAGVGLVGHFGVIHARRKAAASCQQSYDYAFMLLADRLSAEARSPSGESVDPQSARAYQRALRHFAANVPVRSLRVVDGDDAVIASTIAEEIGSKLQHRKRKRAAHTVGETPRPDGLEVAEVTLESVSTATVSERPARLIRACLTDARRTVGSASLHPPYALGVVDDTSVAALYLEAVMPPDPVPAPTLLDHAGALVTVLIVCGALFLLFRGLRTHLRGMSLIADRLQDPLEPAKRDFASLRISDTTDTLTATWNQLMELIASLQDEVSRTQANSELSRALTSMRGGALALALNAVPDAILYVVDEGRFEYLNATAYRLFGWGEAQKGEVTLASALATPVGTRVLEVLRGALLADGTFESRAQLLELPDSDSAYRVWVTPLPGSRHQGECVAVVRDVSQQIRADRAREEFVTQVTHELRTPLTNIRAYAETLSSGMFDDPKVVTECYNVITKETRRLSRLVEDMLSVSQMEVGSIELVTDDVDMKSLLSDSIRDARSLADEKDTDLQLVLPAKLEPIQADRDKLAVVVNNLVGNALKYTPSGGCVVVGCRMTEGEVEITVKDNGLGIDPAEHARVFEKFQRSADPEVQNETGTGIGLYTAREIARRHGGDIDLISQKGQGSTFIVRLPHSESRTNTTAMAREA